MRDTELHPTWRLPYILAVARDRATRGLAQEADDLGTRELAFLDRVLFIASRADAQES